LEREFPKLFKNLPKEEFQGVLNAFVRNRRMQHLPVSLEEQLIDIREDGNLIDEFQEKFFHD